MCVFFFKQKTAYEMRISDWSSDVCSSDLAGLDPVEDERVALGFRHPDIGLGVDFEIDRAALAKFVADDIAGALPAALVGEDRKSVVSGKSVSVRVDLGGRRIIKKK